MAILPDVECALGKPVAMQWAAMLGFERALTDRFRGLGATGFTSADERAEWAAKMAVLSGGRNAIVWVDDGADTPAYFPSIYVRRVARQKSYYISGASDILPHAAFIVDDANIPYYWAGKYPGCSVTSNAKRLVLSLCWVDPLIDPFTGATVYPTHDTAVSYCHNNGTGHHAFSNPEWAEVALDCIKQGYQPKGNNSRGRDSADPDSAEYRGVPCSWDASGICRCLNGSGPLSWFHDGTPWGIWGMNGNIYQWTPGFRQKSGEIQVIANNDTVLAATDQGVDSAAWKAILQDNSLVASGTADTLKFDVTSGITIDTAITTRTTGSVYDQFDDVAPGDGVTIPDVLKELCISPETVGGNLHGGDRMYVRNDLEGSYSETLPLRGGDWSYGSVRGVFCLSLYYSRSNSSYYVGVRPAFVDPEFL